MKVKDLIQELQKLDSETEIAISTRSGEVFCITKINYDSYLGEYVIKKGVVK